MGNDNHFKLLRRRMMQVISTVGPDLSPLFFPLPFLDFFKAKLITKSMRITRKRVILDAGYAGRNDRGSASLCDSFDG